MAANTYWWRRETRFMPSLSIERIVATAVIILFGCCVVTARPAEHDISGMWLLQDPGSGNFTDWYNNVPKPSLRPNIVKDNEALAAREAAGGVINRAERLASCPFGNLPMMMASSPPLNIVQSKDEILIGTESNRGRIIYMDARTHPDAAGLKALNSGVGHSTGHWDGDSLVVDTLGFPARTCDTRWPVMRVPGGGRAKD